MKRQFKCFIFDLDGTLVNTVEDLAAAFNHMRKELGFPQVSIAMVQQMIGNGVRDLICQSFANVNIKPTEDELKNAIKLMIDYYKAHLVVKTAAYPGVAETLEFMHKKGIKTAVVTNKRAEAALGLLEQLDLAEYLYLLFLGLHHNEICLCIDSGRNIGHDTGIIRCLLLLRFYYIQYGYRCCKSYRA